MRYSVEFRGKNVYRVLLNVGRGIRALDINDLLKNQLELPLDIEDERNYIAGIMDIISFSNSNDKEVWNWIFDDADIIIPIN